MAVIVVATLLIISSCVPLKKHTSDVAAATTNGKAAGKQEFLSSAEFAYRCQLDFPPVIIRDTTTTINTEYTILTDTLKVPCKGDSTIVIQTTTNKITERLRQVEKESSARLAQEKRMCDAEAAATRSNYISLLNAADSRIAKLEGEKGDMQARIGVLNKRLGDWWIYAICGFAIGSILTALLIFKIR